MDLRDGWVEVEIALASRDEGGRSVDLDLSSDRRGKYRPHFRVVGGSGDRLGVAFMDGPEEPVPPGGKAVASVVLFYPEHVSYDELVDGAKFEILEGHRIVGHGRVLRK